MGIKSIIIVGMCLLYKGEAQAAHAHKSLRQVPGMVEFLENLQTQAAEGPSVSFFDYSEEFAPPASRDEIIKKCDRVDSASVAQDLRRRAEVILGDRALEDSEMMDRALSAFQEMLDGTNYYACREHQQKNFAEADVSAFFSEEGDYRIRFETGFED